MIFVRGCRVLSPIYQGLAKPIRIIPPISQQPIGGWQAAHQSPGPGVIADLTGGHEEPNRPPNRVRNGMQFGVHTALRTTDQTPTPPPVDSVTLAWFNDATGFQAQSWDAAVEMVLIGQLAVKLAAPESLPAMLPEMPAPAPEPTPPVEAAPAPEPAPQLEPTVADIKAALDAKGVKYSTRDTKADLLALLNA